MQFKLTCLLGERWSRKPNFPHTLPHPKNYVSSWDNNWRSFQWGLCHWQWAFGNVMPPAHLSKQSDENCRALLTRTEPTGTNPFWKHEDVCVHENTTAPRVGTGAGWKPAWLPKPLWDECQRGGLGLESHVCGSTPVFSSMWSFVLGNVVFASKVLIASTTVKNTKVFPIAIYYSSNTGFYKLKYISKFCKPSVCRGVMI